MLHKRDSPKSAEDITAHQVLSDAPARNRTSPEPAPQQMHNDILLKSVQVQQSVRKSEKNALGSHGAMIGDRAAKYMILNAKLEGEYRQAGACGPNRV